MTSTVTLFPKVLSKISLVLLIAYLCAFISHAQHFDLLIDNIEIQQCQLCHNNIDTPADLPVLIDPIFICFTTQLSQSVSSVSISIAYQRPPLRAPPNN